jgi:DNA-directed RNA polymerase subunit RPC12/RpoP
MALINCSECNKDVSDKAEFCPNCGNPINVKKEEYICCPKCRSKELHTGNKGFSGGKALAGVVLTGGIGILAGTHGSKKVIITCLKCGHKFKAGEALIVVDDPNVDEKEIIEVIKNTGKLAAIKHYQSKTSNSLEECKKHVDGIVAKYNVKPNGSEGCMIFLLCATAASIATILYFS